MVADRLPSLQAWSRELLLRRMLQRRLLHPFTFSPPWYMPRRRPMCTPPRQRLTSTNLRLATGGVAGKTTTGKIIEPG